MELEQEPGLCRSLQYKAHQELKCGNNQSQNGNEGIREIN